MLRLNATKVDYFLYQLLNKHGTKMTTLNTGDKVVINKPTRDLTENTVYVIRRINRGIDGAYDWDEIYLEGHTNHFCEFNFNKVEDDKLLNKQGAKMTVIRNAIIESTSLNMENGVLTCWLFLDYGDGTKQGFGGHSLYLPKSYKHHNINSPAGHFIYRCLELTDTTDFDKLARKSVRVALDKAGLGGSILGIGHITKDDWFYPAEDFKRD